MKLKSFRIKNYKSISDTGEIVLSEHDNITVFAGQNESGKSTILEALNTFDTGDFERDSKPFTSHINDIEQSISCTFQISNSDRFFNDLVSNMKSKFHKRISDKNHEIFDKAILSEIKTFTLTRSYNCNKNEKAFNINKGVFDILKASIIEENVIEDTIKEDRTTERKTYLRKKLELTYDEDNEDVATSFWVLSPSFVLFNDFCDLLPDRITLNDLKASNNKVKGYDAVKNLERILDVNFVKLYEIEDLERESIRDEHNDTISIDFQKAWDQKIHDTNKIKLYYDFEKRDTEETSYLNFYTETKDRQKLKPHQRSKGLIWFLSFWLELNANNQENLIILADEPGLYLHIKAQADILKLFDKLSKLGNRILYSTHSPNLIDAQHLNRINLVINDPKKGTIIESITTSKIDTNNKQDALQPVAKAIGFVVNDFALSCKKCAILEGVSDYYYYSGMKKLLNRNMEYSLVPGIGVRKQNTLISFCIGYGIDWVSIFDDDSEKGKDSQKTFSDIKEYLFSNENDAAEAKMRITAGISCVENMFTTQDALLVDSSLKAKADAAKTIGENRKVVFAKLFYEKIESGDITLENLSEKAIENFNQVFDWIEIKLNLA